MLAILDPTSYPGSYLRSPPRSDARCEKTLAAAGHVAPTFWEQTKKSIGGRVRINSLSHKKLYSKYTFLCDKIFLLTLLPINFFVSSQNLGAT